MYCIGKFPDEKDDVAVVPTSWILPNNRCHWPVNSSSVRKLIRRGKVPDTNDKDKWIVCNFAVLKEYDSYKEAQSNLHLATVTSDLDNAPVPSSSINLQRTPPPPPRYSAFPRSLELQMNNEFDEDFFLDQEREAINDLLVVNDIELETAQEKSTQTSPEKREAIDFQEAIVSKLASIQDTQKEHGEMLQLLCNVYSGATIQTGAAVNAPGSEEVEVLKLSLPLATIEELMLFEKSMQTVEGVKSLIKHLTGTGGANIEDAVQRTMEKVMEDRLAAKFSLMGMRGKLKFTDYHATVSAIRESVRSYPSLSQIVASGELDDKSFKASMQASFKRVGDRIFRRRNKRKNSFTSTTLPSLKSCRPNQLLPQASTSASAPLSTSQFFIPVSVENVPQ